MSPQLKYKNKFTTKKKLKRIEIAKNLNKLKYCKRNITPTDLPNDFPCVGRRIVELDYMSNNMECCNCKDLILKNTKEEKKRGLHSTLYIQCKHCPTVTPVATGKEHFVNSETSNHQNEKKEIIHNDVTTKAILGALHSGIGNTELNKLLACLNNPTITPAMFKRYEREVGPAIEAVAKESCIRGAREERVLVIEKAESLCKEL